VQSLDAGLLDRLGRVHSREMVFKSYDILRTAGFDNINLDLMFAIPGQSREVWRETLREALTMGSEHISSYEVIYEEDTALYAQLKAGEFEVDEELACAMYEDLVAMTTGAGFEQYEIANFARAEGGAQENSSRVTNAKPFIPLRACQHNVNYWRGGAFYGLGPSATGYVRGARAKNWSNTQLYCEQLEKGKRAIESSETLSPLARAGETAAFGLRMLVGWEYDEFQRVTGFDLVEEWSEEIGELISKGWGIKTDAGFRLSQEGLRFADAAAELFLRTAETICAK
jgi:oxygen-independent coproporphyrinogen III oxidase